LNQHSLTSSLSSSELLKLLHWLPVEWHIWFKFATLTFKALHTGRPPYLSNLLQHHESMRSLRSSSSHYLSVPHHNLKFGSRAFRSSTLRVWNSLPVSIRESQSLPTFRRNNNNIRLISQDKPLDHNTSYIHICHAGQLSRPRPSSTGQDQCWTAAGSGPGQPT